MEWLLRAMAVSLEHSQASEGSALESQEPRPLSSPNCYHVVSCLSFFGSSHAIASMERLASLLPYFQRAKTQHSCPCPTLSTTIFHQLSLFVEILKWETDWSWVSQWMSWVSLSQGRVGVPGGLWVKQNLQKELWTRAGDKHILSDQEIWSRLF